MKSKYQIGDVVDYRIEYRDAEGRLKERYRPLIVISEPNSKGDYHAIAGSHKIEDWLDEKHILISPDMVSGGGFDKPIIFPASNQVLMDANFVRARIGRIPVEKLETLLRYCLAHYTESYYRGVYSPKRETSFSPGQSPVAVSGRVCGPEEMQNIVDSALDCWLTTGRFNQAFEKQFAEFLGVKYALTTNSGSSANLLAVSALTSPKLGDSRLKPDDEVITLAAGFPTTVNPIVQNGLVPVFVDVDIPTYNIQSDQIEAAISDKTRAVMLAHTLGNPFNLDEVIRVCHKYGLWLIEDCCDALGSEYYFSDGTGEGGQPAVKGNLSSRRQCGTFGHISTFSFYPAHHITMGEGGAVVTNDAKLNKMLKSFRDWGRDCCCAPGHDNTCNRRFDMQFGDLPYGYDHKYIYSHLGYNLKITDMQAAVGLAQLRRVNGFIKTRKRNFKILYDGFRDLEEFFFLPQATPGSDPSWFGFPLAVRSDAPFSRDSLIRHLDQHKIGTRLLFGGNLICQPAYKDLVYRKVGDLPNSDFVMNQVFWLGVYPGLKEDMLDYIIDMIKSYISNFLTNRCVSGFERRSA